MTIYKLCRKCKEYIEEYDVLEKKGIHCKTCSKAIRKHWQEKIKEEWLSK